MMSSNPPSTTEPTPESYQPSDVQIARAAALKRFNRLAVFLPIGLTAVLLLACLGFLIWRAVAPAETVFFSRTTLSGIADLLLIFTILPLLLLQAIVVGGAIYGLIYLRQQQQKRPLYEQNRLRLLLWKLGNILDTIQTKLTSYSELVINPLIQTNARFNQLAQTISRLIKPNQPPEPPIR